MNRNESLTKKPFEFKRQESIPIDLKWNPLIQGLRALAILGVLAFHFFPKNFPNGFLGVDIFFVISGYVITRKILIDKQNFGWIKKFYFDRYIRIVPSLFLLLTLVSILTFLLTKSYRNLIAELFYSLIFASNFYYFAKSDYFAPSSNTQSLLHLWSLGVEIQFYLLFPWLIKIKNNRGWYVIAIMSLFSILLFSFTAQSHPEFNFYLIFSRFWEFALGSALVLEQQKNKFKTVLHLSRDKSPFYLLPLLLLCIVLTPWFEMSKQGLNIICSVLTAVTIFSNASLKIIANKFVQFIGRISYELYLVHWSIYSIFVYQINDSYFYQTKFKILLILLSILLSVVIYKLGSRIRKVLGFKKILVIHTLSLAVLFAALFGFSANSKVSDKLIPIEGVKCKYIDDTSQFLEFCQVIKQGNQKKVLVLWGDSLASAYSRAFVESPELRNYTIYRVSVPACGPFPNLRRTDNSFGSEWCGTSVMQRDIFKYIYELKPDMLAIIARWDLYLRGLYLNGNLIESKFYTSDTEDATEQTSQKAIPVELGRVVSEFSNSNVRVILFGESPFLDQPTEYYLQNNDYPKHVIPHDYLEIRSLVTAAVIEPLQRTNAVIFSPYDILCPKDKCALTIEGQLVFQDQVHITDHMSRLIAKDFRFRAVLNANSTK